MAPPLSSGHERESHGAKRHMTMAVGKGAGVRRACHRPHARETSPPQNAWRPRAASVAPPVILAHSSIYSASLTYQCRTLVRVLNRRLPQVPHPLHVGQWHERRPATHGRERAGVSGRCGQDGEGVRGEASTCGVLRCAVRASGHSSWACHLLALTPHRHTRWLVCREEVHAQQLSCSVLPGTRADSAGVECNEMPLVRPLLT